MTEIQKTVNVNRKYKDRLFRLRFGSEEYKEFDKPQYAHKGTDVFWKFIRSVYKGEQTKYIWEKATENTNSAVHRFLQW